MPPDDWHIIIRRMTGSDADTVVGAAALFDSLPTRPWTSAFLDAANHHLLLAATSAGRPVGFVSGMEILHPDKGSEMLLYELGVAEDVRRRGIGRALVRALEQLARDRGCAGMWVLTEPDDEPPVRTYVSAGGTAQAVGEMVVWSFDDAPAPS